MYNTTRCTNCTFFTAGVNNAVHKDQERTGGDLNTTDTKTKEEAFKSLLNQAKMNAKVIRELQMQNKEKDMIIHTLEQLLCIAENERFDF